MQQGQFLIQGRREGRLFESTHWGGGVDGHMLEEPSVTAESKFVQEQIERRLDGEERRILTPMLDLLDALLLDQRLSPLFKAYLHDKLYEIMSLRADEWGLRLSTYLKKDHVGLKAIMNVPLQATDWMNPAAYEAMQGKLALYYRPLAQRRYSEEVKFNLSLLRDLTSLSFPYAGYVDERGQARYLNAGNPPAFTWCLGRTKGEIGLQRFKGANALPFSPLLTVDKDLEAVFKKAVAEAGAAGTSKFGDVESSIPFRYSD
jgi:hypothetical protein